MCIIQFIFTNYYSNKLVRVLGWKLKDTEIAFGTDNYQYKSYSKTLSTFKRFVFVYKIVVFLFCLHLVLHTLTYLASVLHPRRMFQLYGICLNFSNYHLYIKILNDLVVITSSIEKVPLAISMVFLFLMNLFTIPSLLSRINITCNMNLKYLFIRTNRSMRVSLLA